MEQIFGRLFITSLMSHTAERNFVEFVHYTFLPEQVCSKGLNDVSRLSEKISFIGIIYEFCRGNLSPIRPNELYCLNCAVIPSIYKASP